MKIFFFLCLSILTLTQGFSQNEKSNKVTESRAVSNFNAIHVSLAADVFLTQADSFSFVAEGRSKLIKLLETEIVDGVLKIHLDKDSDLWDNVDKLSIHISAPSFEKIILSGAGKIKTENKLTGTSLLMVISGANNVDFQAVELGALTVQLSGVGNVNISGKATKATVDISGTGHIDMLDLVVQDARCDISGMGKLSCFVENDLDAQVSGLGTIRYKGEPKLLRKNVSGIGKVKKD